MKKTITAIFTALWSVCTGMVGYQIHGSLFWAVLDGIFSILSWCKWLVCHEVSMSLIRDTFSFFLS